MRIICTPQSATIEAADGTHFLEGVTSIDFDATPHEQPQPADNPPPLFWRNARAKPANSAEIQALIERYGYLECEFTTRTRVGLDYTIARAVEFIPATATTANDLRLSDGAPASTKFYRYQDGTLDAVARLVYGYGYKEQV